MESSWHPTAAQSTPALLFQINILSFLPYLFPKEIFFQPSGQRSDHLANSRLLGMMLSFSEHLHFEVEKDKGMGHTFWGKKSPVFFEPFCN